VTPKRTKTISRHHPGKMRRTGLPTLLSRKEIRTQPPPAPTANHTGIPRHTISRPSRPRQNLRPHSKRLQKMRETIAQYVRNCFQCNRSKPTHHAPHGILKPLPIPTRPWEELSMDFVTGLPLSERFDAVMVIVDLLTKQRHLIPCRTTANSRS
jgi:hypothetical protein